MGCVDKICKGVETVSRGLKIILRVRRLRRSFCNAYGGSAPPTFMYRPAPDILLPTEWKRRLMVTLLNGRLGSKLNGEILTKNGWIY